MPSHPPYTRIGIVYGHGGFYENHWQTWLARECEKAGLETHYPDLPEPKKPILAEWIDALKKDMPVVDDKTALVGHSLGCAAILHWLKSPTIKTVGSVILVGPAAEGNVAQSKLSFLTPFHQNLDLQVVRKKAKQIELFASDEDIWMSLDDSKKLAQELGARLHVFHNAGHLSINHGYTSFPEVLELIVGKTNEKANQSGNESH
ncbi:serine hydrolase family protein [Candidatus Micrarchaeota archaeon]|nr:serine hydrolase family protein [Candidatus Micrarchaeota archaeon]